MKILKNIKKPKKLFFLNIFRQLIGSSILKFFICKKNILNIGTNKKIKYKNLNSIKKPIMINEIIKII